MSTASTPFTSPFSDPEEFILRWHREGSPYPFSVFVLLAGIAVIGTAAYGALLGVPGDAARVLECCLLFTAASALSWAAPLPAVYIFGSIFGSRLRPSTTFLAALLTACWGGFGFLALLPIAGVVVWAFPFPRVVLTTHLVVFATVGGCMAVIYHRLQTGVEPLRASGRSWWLWLFVLLQIELIYAFGLLKFSLPT